MGMFSQSLQTLGYLLLLIILVVLWSRVVRQRVWRKYWVLLALAWTMNLLGNIAWVIHDLVTGTPLSTFSLVDLFYVLRYVLISLALWIFPIPLGKRSGLWIGISALVTSMLVWAIYFKPAMQVNGGDWISFLGLALYPILDVAIITLSWLRLRAMSVAPWNKAMLILFLAMTSYGIANTINLSEYVFLASSAGWVQNVFWIVTDILLLAMLFGTGLGQGSLKSE